MASKRLVEMVYKVAGKHSGLTTNEAVELLEKQHAAVVQMVKRYRDADKLNLCRRVACNDILAALATHRKGRT